MAYVTRDLIGLKKRDTLIVDASERRIANGDTSAKILRRLRRRGVNIFNCAYLHAKVVLMDDYVVIGSGNMSKLSSDTLIEAGILTDSAAAVSGAAALIAKLATPEAELDKERIAQLCKIKVKRQFAYGGGRSKKQNLSALGNRAWLIGVREFLREPTGQEARLVDDAYDAPEKKHGNKLDFDWIKWGTKDRFAREAKAGDTIIQIWRSRSAKRPSVVYKATPILLKQRTRRWTRFYVAESSGAGHTIRWGAFKKLMSEVGYKNKLTPAMAREIDTDLVDVMRRKWRN